MKTETAIIQGGKYHGEQLLSAEYVKEIMNPAKGEGYFYFFHNRHKTVSGRSERGYLASTNRTSLNYAKKTALLRLKARARGND